MKKLISLLLALVMSACVLAPVLAETEAEAVARPAAFTFDLDGFMMWFGNFATASGLEAAPTCTVAEDGLSAVVEAQPWCTVAVTMDAEGKVTALAFETAMTIADMQEKAPYFGFAIAMVTLSAKAAEDISFVMDTEQTDLLETELSELVMALTNRITDALVAPVSESGEIAGHLATVFLSVDAATLTLTFGYAYEP